ncbi:MAG: Fe-S protein assembly co-chaperone HscB [Deltaproteobacteria bacterium]|nr:Fe-S protein assembly co-chaperone HscB [Deltaproteobacteria bacterium]
MICWSCQRDAGRGPLCEACGAVQPVPAQANLFEVLGLPQTHFLEPLAVEERFKDLNRKLHPDRFAQKTPRERRMSLDWTTQVNDAARTLRDPLKRATYLVRLGGIDVEKECGTGAMRRLPPEFLEETLEQREALEEAKAAKDLEKVRALAQAVEKRSAAILDRLSSAMREFESSRERAALERAGDALAVLKYFSRFLEEVEAIEMAALE